jgi:hypothetical protein
VRRAVFPTDAPQHPLLLHTSFRCLDELSTFDLDLDTPETHFMPHASLMAMTLDETRTVTWQSITSRVATPKSHDDLIRNSIQLR